MGGTGMVRLVMVLPGGQGESTLTRWPHSQQGLVWGEYPDQVTLLFPLPARSGVPW